MKHKGNYGYEPPLRETVRKGKPEMDLYEEWELDSKLTVLHRGVCQAIPNRMRERIWKKQLTQ